MRRPDWWPRGLWPGGTESDAHSPSRGRTGTAVEISPPPKGGPRRGRTGSEDPWPGLLDLLVEALGAASAAVWRLDEEARRWEVAAERRRPGWSGPERTPGSERGHPFTWAAREELVLQIPAERIREGAREGWALLVPESGGRYLVELWFTSAPGPAVRESASAIRSHLAWVVSVLPEGRAAG